MKNNGIKKYLKIYESKRIESDTVLSLLNKEKKILEDELERKLSGINKKRALLEQTLNTFHSLKILNTDSMTIIRNIQDLDKEFLDNFYIIEAVIEFEKHWHRGGEFDFSFHKLYIEDDEYKKLGDDGNFIKKMNEQLWSFNECHGLTLDDYNGLYGKFIGFETASIRDLTEKIFNVDEIKFVYGHFDIYLLMKKNSVKNYKNLNIKLNKEKEKSNKKNKNKIKL